MLDKFFKFFARFVPVKFRWILNHDGFKRYFANTGWMFFGRFFMLGISFFVGIYIARYLGPSNYGLVSYVISFVGLFGFLASFGIDTIAGREIIKNHDKKDEIIGTSFFIKIMGGLLAVITVFIVSLFITKDLFTLGLIWIFSFSFIFQAFNIIEIYFQSQVLSKKIVTAQILSNIITAVLKILCIILGKGIFWLTLIYVFETVIYSAFLIFSFSKLGYRIKKWRFNLKLAKTLLVDSWPLMLASVAVGISMKIDQVMVKNMLGNEQAGVYAVAVKVSEIWYFIPMLICSSVSPAIIKAFATSKEIFENRMRKLYFLMFWLSFGIAFFGTVLAYPIIKILFGEPYIGAVPVFQIYIWAGIAVFLGVATGQYLLASNLTKISFYNTILGAIVNVVLNIILIPKIGMIGAAIVTLISYTISAFGIFLFKKSRNQGWLILKSIISYK